MATIAGGYRQALAQVAFTRGKISLKMPSHLQRQMPADAKGLM